MLNEHPFDARDAPPCSDCPAVRLDEFLASSEAHWLGSTVDLDFALQAGIAITLAEIAYPEFLLLRILTEERNKWLEEQVKEAAERGKQPNLPPGRSLIG